MVKSLRGLDDSPWSGHGNSWQNRWDAGLGLLPLCPLSDNGSVSSSVANTSLVVLICFLLRRWVAPLPASTSSDLGSANFCDTMAGSQTSVVGFCIRTL